MNQFFRTLVLLLVAGNLLMAGNPDLENGWKLFQENKRPQAGEAFKKALTSSDAQADAALAMSILSWTLGQEADALKYFMDFYSKAPDPAPYAFALWSTNCLHGRSGVPTKEQSAFYQTMLADSRSNGTINAMLQRVLGYNLQHQGNFEKANIEFAKQGYLNKWSIVGSFDNFSASGFNKDFKVLQNPKSDAVFINKNNAEVKWFEVKNVRNDGWLDFKYHLSWGNAVMYAQTYINSGSEREVFMRTGVSGAVKVWVNDQLILSDAQERNCDLDTYNNKIKLKKGFNRILVQISESEVNSANVMIRLTDEKGTPVALGEQSATYQPYEKAEGPLAELLPHFAEAFFKKKVEQNPNSYVDHILLAMVYNRNERLFEARKTLLSARKLPPINGTVSRLFLDTYGSEDNSTQYTKEQEFIKANDPDNYYSLQLKFEEEFKKENYTESEKVLNRMIELFGVDETIEMYRLRQVAEKNNQEETMRMVNSLYAKYPNSYSFMSIKYSVETSGNKQLSKGNAILKKYAKKNFSDDVNTKMAGNYFQLGMGELGMKIYLDRVNRWPYSISVYDDLAEIYMNLERYSDALYWQKKTLELAPYTGYYWNKLAEIYKAMGNNEASKENFKKAIYYDPSDYDSRKQLRELEDKKDMFEYFPKVDAYELYSKSPKAEDYPEDNSIILLNENQKVVYPEGASEERGELLVKVFKQQGIEVWKDYSLGSGNSERLNIEKAEIIKPNGQKVQAETDGGYIVFTSLEIGDAIHVVWKKERYASGKLAKHFWERFNMNYFFPAKSSKYSLLVANNHTFNHKVLNSDLTPDIKDVEDYKLYTWELKDQASIKEEPYMPSLSDIGVVLEFSSIPDWNFVADWYSDISTTKTKADFEVKEVVEELFKDKKNLTDLQKAKLIYDYIVHNINYSNVSFLQSGIVPQKAATTINYKLGDCKDVSTLFVSMAKEVGLKANVVLVDTRDNGEKDMVLPSIGFNHCIAQLNADNKNYFIELTSSKLSFGAQSSSAVKSLSLSIPQESGKGKYEIMQMPSNHRTPNQILRRSSISFQGDEMQMNKKTYKTGVFAEFMRRDYGELGKENQEKDMLRAISSDYTTQVKLQEISFKDLKTLSDTAEYDCKFTVQKSLVDFAGMKLFKLPWTEAFNFTEYFSLEKRKYDFNIWELNDIEFAEEIMTIDIPAGKTLVEPPKVVKFSCDHAEYSLSYTQQGNKLVVTRAMKYKKDIITPSEYAAAKEFFQKVSEYDSKQIGFK
jgi:tetratricopeptide (TPR) repeat protein